MPWPYVHHEATVNQKRSSRAKVLWVLAFLICLRYVYNRIVPLRNTIKSQGMTGVDGICDKSSRRVVRQTYPPLVILLNCGCFNVAILGEVKLHYLWWKLSVMLPKTNNVIPCSLHYKALIPWLKRMCHDTMMAPKLFRRATVIQDQVAFRNPEKYSVTARRKHYQSSKSHHVTNSKIRYVASSSRNRLMNKRQNESIIPAVCSPMCW